MAHPSFFCDDHLRRLARWLRAAGYDTAWEPEIADRELVRRCREEGRVLLTLDREMRTAVAVDVFVLPTHDPLEQLRLVQDRYGLDLLSHAFTRCPVCNVELERAEKKDVEVPERVRASCTEFWRCPDCARVFWHGDHVRHMRTRFTSLRSQAPDESP